MLNKKNNYVLMFSTIFLALFSFKINACASVLVPEADTSSATIHSFADYSSVLGKDTAGEPLYYINIVLDIIRYAAIICLLGFSIADFVKAIVSDDKDALKKAGTTTMKRFIYCVMIFFLKIIINFLLDLFQLTGMIGVIR